MSGGWMTITRVGEEIRVDHADDEILVAAEVLANADARYLTVADDVMTVTASNGTWRYRIGGFDTHRGHYTCNRIKDAS